MNLSKRTEGCSAGQVIDGALRHRHQVFSTKAEGVQGQGPMELAACCYQIWLNNIRRKKSRHDITVVSELDLSAKLAILLLKEPDCAGGILFKRRPTHLRQTCGSVLDGPIENRGKDSFLRVRGRAVSRAIGCRCLRESLEHLAS